VASEEIVVGANGSSLDKNFKTEVLYCEDIKNCCNETVEYQSSIDPLSLTKNSNVNNWNYENISTSTLKVFCYIQVDEFQFYLFIDYFILIVMFTYDIRL